MKTILSYPRSGNHLLRFFIELITERPTKGMTPSDRPICENTFKEIVPFNITDVENFEYEKRHTPPEENTDELIVILRNPREVLVHGTFSKDKSQNYFDIVDYYDDFEGRKLLLTYEEMIKDKKGFIEKLYNFLEVTNMKKKEYALEWIDTLYDLSATATNRSWRGINSDNPDKYHWERVPVEIRKKIDSYISEEVAKRPTLQGKWN